MAAAATIDEKKAAIVASIRVIPDFPKAGIMFQDVSTLLLDPVAFQYAIDLLVERYRAMDIQCIAGGGRGSEAGAHGSSARSAQSRAGCLDASSRTRPVTSIPSLIGE